MNPKYFIDKRFRGFLPVVIDVETGGLNATTDALLEIAAVIVGFNEAGQLEPKSEQSYHVIPFKGANLEEAALEFNGIDPFHPFRFAISEKEMLQELFLSVNEALKESRCSRAVLVGHNAWFDLSFLNAAIQRTGVKNPFHQFTCFDTATLAGLCFGQTVLKRALNLADIPYDNDEAHSALYDASCTAKLFCHIVNHWGTLGGWPLDPLLSKLSASTNRK